MPNFPQDDGGNSDKRDENQGVSLLFLSHFFEKQSIQREGRLAGFLEKRKIKKENEIFQKMKIALLDDKDFGLLQVKNALPEAFLGEVQYFETAKEFLKNAEMYDVLLLDFYLDQDGITSAEIFDQIRPHAKIIIAFSSSRSANQKLKKLGAKFAVEKLWEDKNEALWNCLCEIFLKK